MFKRPIAGVSIGLTVGLFAGYALGLPLFCACLGLFIFSLGSLLAWGIEEKTEKGLTFIFICLSMFFLGVTIFQGEKYILANQALALGKIKTPVSIRGIIATFPEKRSVYYVVEEEEKAVDKTSFSLDIEQIKRKEMWEDKDGKVLINIYEPDRDFDIGDQLEIEGGLIPLPLIRNPADFDYGAFLFRQGIMASINLREKEAVKVLAKDRLNPMMRLAGRMRGWMERIIDLGPYNGRGELLKAMIIGKRENLSERLKNDFINTGTIHILAISGMNMGIVMATVLAGCKLIFFPRKWANLLCILALIFYALLTGGRASVWRATIMASLFLAGHFLNRQVDKWTSFSLAALAILFFSPSALFDSGFQLTFLAVGGLMYFYPKLESLFRLKWPGLFNQTINRYLLKSLLGILAAELALGPFLIYYYYRFPLTAFVANLLVVPSLGLATVLGFIASLAGIISFPLAQAFNATNSLVLLIMDKVNSFLGNLPGQIIYLPEPGPVFFLVYYAVLFLLFSSFKERSS